MKPEFVLINWSIGSCVGIGTEDECRAQLQKCVDNDLTSDDTFLIAKTVMLSEMKRVES